MKGFKWPENFPDERLMYSMLQKMAKVSWQNDNSFSFGDIDMWLNNFTGEVYEKEIEQRIALWLLCNFTYYNKEEISYLCYVVFKQFLHDIATSNDVKTDNELQRIWDTIFFAAMGEASESGGLLLYYFRQQSRLSLSKFYYPSVLPKNEDGIIVFIDDITLSGDSALRFFDNNLGVMKYKKAYYLTLFASEDAIVRIEQYGIKMIESTVLGERERCFSEKSMVFSAFPELKDIAKRIVEAYGEKLLAGNPLGYKDGQYSFGLYYNTPNNTLPIFWSCNNWNPVFPRKEKKYHDQRGFEYDRYI